MFTYDYNDNDELTQDEIEYFAINEDIFENLWEEKGDDAKVTKEELRDYFLAYYIENPQDLPNWAKY